MRIDVYKPTQDDWYGNFKIHNDCRVSDLVRVSFCQTGPNPKYGDGMWRVCVWGNDDCGMEKDFHLEGSAINTFYQIIGQEFVNRQYLKDMGFISA